jgi:hypothetical protein
LPLAGRTYWALVSLLASRCRRPARTTFSCARAFLLAVEIVTPSSLEAHEAWRRERMCVIIIADVDI